MHASIDYCLPKELIIVCLKDSTINFRCKSMLFTWSFGYGHCEICEGVALPGLNRIVCSKGLPNVTFAGVPVTLNQTWSERSSGAWSTFSGKLTWGYRWWQGDGGPLFWENLFSRLNQPYYKLYVAFLLFVYLFRWTFIVLKSECKLIYLCMKLILYGLP